MRTIAFVGPSGTGKSYRAAMVSAQNGADAIIDDGILIAHGKILAGSSAKKEHTRIASVKHALFIGDEYADEMSRAIKNSDIKCLMILGTSEAMAERIAGRLGVGPIEKIIRIEDVATVEEMETARNMRLNQGKHVIPVPAVEIKKDFSGYFMQSLGGFFKKSPNVKDSAEKSIVRPTFSYMGDFIISDNAVREMIKHEAESVSGVRVGSVKLRKTEHGLHIDMVISMKYGKKIYNTGRKIQERVKKNIEEYTSINVRRVYVIVKGLIV